MSSLRGFLLHSWWQSNATHCVAPGISSKPSPSCDFRISPCKNFQLRADRWNHDCLYLKKFTSSLRRLESRIASNAVTQILQKTFELRNNVQNWHAYPYWPTSALVCRQISPMRQGMLQKSVRLMIKLWVIAPSKESRVEKKPGSRAWFLSDLWF